MKRLVAVVCALVIVVAIVPAARRTVLQRVGGVLVVSDPDAPADVGVMTESGEGDEIGVSDLYRRHAFPRVLVLAPSPNAVDLELKTRGVHHEDRVLSTLRQLGVPPSALSTLDAGEGGTNDSARALAAWARDHPSRVLVVISPTHARRYRRTLLRVWPHGVPPPRITWSPHALFRSDDWWRSRRTLREGLFELEKLAWDYVTHPF
jgi:uncharacterized SAM-binding protein YcdF (DUF218 family)